MEIYSVGGAVRDGLLNLEVQDRDFVVVGATPEALQELGFVPVGRDFPVFLHPETHEEYALARTERKTAPGYRGFSFHADPNVTLEEDLARRDLTINAMAQDAHGRLIDPFGGQRDLKARVLRHVGPAFVEDPVRILRLARFAARFTAFSIAPETLALVRQMVAAGEVDALVPERVWQEMARGLMEAQPSRMLQVLAECGALARLAPEIDAAQGGRWQALDRSARQGRSLPVRSAVWLTEAGLGPEAIVRFCQRLRVPAQCSDVARMTARERATIARPDPLAAGEQLALLERCDALRRGERFEMLLAALADLEDIDLHDLRLERLRHALFVVHRVDTAAVAGRAAGGDVGRAVREARLEALTEAMR